MARTYTKNTSNFMNLGVNTVGPLIAGAATISVHAWVKAASTTTAAFDNFVLGVCINGTGNGLVLALDKSGANRVARVSARSVQTDTIRSGLSTTDLALSTWHSIGGVVDIAGDFITPYANGVAEGGTAAAFTNTSYTNGTPTGNDRIGANNSVTPTTAAQFDGEIGEMAIWSGTVSANSFAGLAAGVTADRIADNNGNFPVFYMPIWGTDSPEYCLICGATGTITGSLPAANHAPVEPYLAPLSRSSLIVVPPDFQAAWAHRSNRLVGGGVWV